MPSILLSVVEKYILSITGGIALLMDIINKLQSVIAWVKDDCYDKNFHVKYVCVLNGKSSFKFFEKETTDTMQNCYVGRCNVHIKFTNTTEPSQ